MHNAIKGQILFIITISFLLMGSVNAAQKAKTFGPIKKGYSIWLVAKKTRPQGVSHEQMMNALFHLNPTAFEKGDINRLEVGSTLNLPTSKQDVLDILSGKSIQSADDSKKKETAKTAKSTAPAPISENTKAAIKAAMAAQAASKQLNFEWRDMGKMLKKAEKLASEGKNDKAEAIANMIVKHAEQAKIQAKLAKSVEPQFKTTTAPDTTTDTTETTTKAKQVAAAVVATATTAVKKATEEKPKAGSADMFKAAKEAQAASKKLHFEWRDMGIMLKKAEKLASDGKADKAKGIADMIVKHAEQAKIQAELAKSAGPRF